MSNVPDWQVRLSGWELQRGTLNALHTGVPSNLHSESYVPALARGKDFAENLKTTGEY